MSELISKENNININPAGFDPTFERIPFLDKIRYVEEVVRGHDEKLIHKQLQDLQILLNSIYLYRASHTNGKEEPLRRAINVIVSEPPPKWMKSQNSMYRAFPGVAFIEESSKHAYQIDFVADDGDLYVRFTERKGDQMGQEHSFLVDDIVGISFDII